VKFARKSVRRFGRQPRRDNVGRNPAKAGAAVHGQLQPLMVESMAFKKGSIHFADAGEMTILPKSAKPGNGALRGDLLAD